MGAYDQRGQSSLERHDQGGQSSLERHEPPGATQGGIIRGASLGGHYHATWTRGKGSSSPHPTPTPEACPHYCNPNALCARLACDACCCSHEHDHDRDEQQRQHVGQRGGQGAADDGQVRLEAAVVDEPDHQHEQHDALQEEGGKSAGGADVFTGGRHLGVP